MRRCLGFGFASLLLVSSISGVCAAAPAKVVESMEGAQERDGVVLATGPTAIILIGDGGMSSYQVSAKLQIAETPASQTKKKKGKGKAASTGISAILMPSDIRNPWNKGVSLLQIMPDGAGEVLKASAEGFDAEKGKWLKSKGEGGSMTYTFWPIPLGSSAGSATAAKPKEPSTDKGRHAQQKREAKLEKEAKLADAGIKEQTWKNRWMDLHFEVTPRFITAWFYGRMLHRYDRPAGSKGPLVIVLPQGDKLKEIAVTPWDSRYLLLDAAAYANDHFQARFEKTHLDVGGVPFELAATEQNCLNLKAQGAKGASQCSTIPACRR